jgi:hypothetical protein
MYTARKSFHPIGFRFGKGVAGAGFKKAGDVQEDAHENHGDEEGENPKGLKGFRSVQALDDLRPGQEPSGEDQQRPQKGAKKVRIQTKLALSGADVKIGSGKREPNRGQTGSKENEAYRKHRESPKPCPVGLGCSGEALLARTESRPWAHARADLYLRPRFPSNP